MLAADHPAKYCGGRLCRAVGSVGAAICVDSVCDTIVLPVPSPSPRPIRTSLPDAGEGLTTLARMALVRDHEAVASW